jgi:hypothetical protein
LWKRILIGRAYHRSANLASMITPLGERFKHAEANYRLARRWNLPGGWCLGALGQEGEMVKMQKRFGIAIATALLSSPFAAQGQGIPVVRNAAPPKVVPPAPEGGAVGGVVGGVAGGISGLLASMKLLAFTTM